MAEKEQSVQATEARSLAVGEVVTTSMHPWSDNLATSIAADTNTPILESKYTETPNQGLGSEGRAIPAVVGKDL